MENDEPSLTSPSIKILNETPSKLITAPPSKPPSKSEVRHRPARPGWILRRANTISLCFSRDNQSSDQSSVYDLPPQGGEGGKFLRKRQETEEGDNGEDTEAEGEVRDQAEVEDSNGHSWQNNNKDPIKAFCRGSLKKLRNAESKVIIAKKDVEDILIQSDAEPKKETICDPKIQRLEEDKVMLSEVQQEINHLISEFSSLVTEEEERIVKKARILEKHNSCTEFKHVSYVKNKSEFSLEVATDEEGEEETEPKVSTDEEATE